MRHALLRLALVMCIAYPTIAAGQDREGCVDSKLLSRVAGCRIAWCEKSEFDAATLPIAASGEHQSKSLEGAIEKIHYSCDGKSGLQVRRNTEQALKAAGFTVDFSDYNLPVHYVTGHKGGTWIAVEASELTGSSAYTLTTVVTEEMRQDMVADADTWAKEINKTGQAAIYGIEFDTGKAVLKPESQNVLSQVLLLLNNQPAWNMRVEGHTDATGTKQGNKALSEQRAAAVVSWLVKNGVASSRLTSVGLGDTVPVADNNTEEGRARNRRVVLAKR